MRRAIVWFRNDLRLNDNEALSDALALADEIVPLFIFDERVFKGTTKFGFLKTDKFRAKFYIEAIQNLREQLQQLGSNLYIAVGKPEEIIASKAREWKTQWVFCNRDRTQEEVDVQDKLEQNLWVIGQEVKYYRGKLLLHTADLPFPISHCPDVFTSFRKETENFVKIRKPIPYPNRDFPNLSIDIDWGVVPSLEDFGHDTFEVSKGIRLEGGEKAGLELLNKYLWQSGNIEQYKKTRNGLLGMDYSSKFSAYLSAGCLSPKYIYNEIKKYEKERVKNESTYWLIFELLWRDFFRFMAKKHNNKIFQIGGIKEVPHQNKDIDYDLFEKWKTGNTGIPFIDANMRELNHTGFMSNRGRQNVASFLVKDLNINWIIGAEYFESLLIDYDPCSNYGNWNYVAGVGTDLRENRYFNIISQAKKYDLKGCYVKYWIPELSDVPADCVHRPDKIPKSSLQTFGVQINNNYPEPCINTDIWN